VIVEQQGFDLFTLGKPSLDIDCYCPVYLWSEYAISQIMKSYEITYRNIVVDCDPGTEIFPRKILDQIAHNPGIDDLLMVIDGSRMSLDTAKDIQDEVTRRKMRVRNLLAVCNRVDDVSLQKEIKKTAINDYGIELIGFVPTDVAISKAGLLNQGLADIDKSLAYKAVKDFMNILRSL
jgi:CO dehydrogenase nickel-insertion accessory protein CooC1